MNIQLPYSRPDSTSSMQAPGQHPKRKCGRLTAAGKPCRSWAIQGSDPPLCSVHGDAKSARHGASQTQGASPEESQNLYGRHFGPHEIADLVAYALEDSLIGEIAATRVTLSRVLDELEQEHTVERRTRLADLLFKGANTIAKLVRTQRAISGDDTDEYSQAIAQALDILSDEWQLDL